MKTFNTLIAAVFLFAGNAQGQMLHKCVSGSGAVSWQSAQCAQGTHQIRSIVYTPETPALVPASVHVRGNAATTPRAAKRSRNRLSTSTHRAKPDACERARERRESTLERVGLKRNFDLLSKLDADVRAVCR